MSTRSRKRKAANRKQERTISIPALNGIKKLSKAMPNVFYYEQTFKTGADGSIEMIGMSGAEAKKKNPALKCDDDDVITLPVVESEKLMAMTEEGHYKMLKDAYKESGEKGVNEYFEMMMKKYQEALETYPEFYETT